MTANSVFDLSISCSEDIIQKFHTTGNLADRYIDINKGVTDLVFESNIYRRAHVSIVDARENRKLWLLHVTVFPHIHNPAPIYGFDIISGPSRVSGAFHDLSFAGSRDVIMPWFADRTQNLSWNKKRELPDWAKQIFSDNIVAIGAVGPDELQEFVKLGKETLEYYLEKLPETNDSNIDTTDDQNKYCHYQKQNQHTPRVLVNLGFTEDEARSFVSDRLFPEIKATYK